MQLGRKLAEGYAVDLEADIEYTPPAVEETPEPQPVEQPARA